MARQKKLTRKEKVALSQEEFMEEVKEKEFIPIPPEELGITDKEVIKKILIYSEEDVWDDDWRHPKMHYIVNALGMHIYFKTNSRATAQGLSDKIYGKGFYQIKVALKAAIR